MNKVPGYEALNWECFGNCTHLLFFCGLLPAAVVATHREFKKSHVMT